MAKTVQAGTFAGPPQPFTGADLSVFYKKLPAFCRVVVHAHPSVDSDIILEVWMPVTGWNGKLQGIGNGGFAGLIDYFELGTAVAKGYAATATDTGHAGSPIDAEWALGHPDKIIDFGHRGVHDMTRIAKIAVQQFYGAAPLHSYFAGCSDGGREALMEAQRYPLDYDGILAGAPANYWTALLSMAAVDVQALTATPDSFIPQSKIPAIGGAVRAACDSLDGVRDGVVSDPRQCQFDPASIECKPGSDAATCLTVPQVTALKAIYAGLQDSSGHSIFPGYLPGGEEGQGGWGLWITGPAPGRSLMAAFGNGYFTDMVFNDPHWEMKSFSLESGMKTAQLKTAEALDAVSPDLTSFQAHGGKLILYHGWNDPAIPARNTVQYYDSLKEKMGENATDAFVRLYMLPGVQHCGGGPGADDIGSTGASTSSDPGHNVRLALEAWVEKGTAPKSFIATKSEDEGHSTSMTRLVCSYPEASKYNGAGDPNSASSYSCVLAPR
jgi:feruloyl esterase